MMEYYYCWRCQCEVPFLNEDEWSLLSPFVDNFSGSIRAYKRENNCSVKEAHVAIGNLITSTYNSITGFNETNYLAVYHHRRSLLGNECVNCGHLYRTPRASYCAHCGHK